MRRPLLIGTNNEGKARELAGLLEGLPWEIKGLRDFAPVPQPLENGATFEANALIKTSYYMERLEIACVAEDSGLVVDALGGAPGIHSARYAGEDCNPDNNMAKLLRELEGTLWHERTARFVCCAAFVMPEQPPHIEVGEVEGHIAMARFGNNGFGYDPVFVPAAHDRTFAEMPLEEKHALSHRGRAFKQMRSYLETLA